MNLGDLPDDSDTSDEDYLPNKKPEEIGSEADSDGVSEDPLSETEDLGKRGKKRKKQFTKRKAKKAETQQETDEETKVETEEEKKKKEEDIWADFMKDTGFVPKNSKPIQAKPEIKKPEPQKEPPKPEPKKVTITQIFEFAGEEVQVKKEVDPNSAEARLLGSSSNSKPKRASGGLSGISSVLSQLGKKQKISTLEKSKLDWDKYKQEENIEEELKAYTKGKDGYLDRQDFLERADLRRFEIEKEIRTVERNKRLNQSI